MALGLFSGLLLHSDSALRHEGVNVTLIVQHVLFTPTMTINWFSWDCNLICHPLRYVLALLNQHPGKFAGVRLVFIQRPNAVT